MCPLCLDTYVYMNRMCSCKTPGRKPFFPKKVKPKANDLLPSGHKHDCAILLDRVGHYEWFECSCGHAHKVYVD